MIDWIKHILEYDKVKAYLERTLDLANALSDILKTFDFTQGKFFTFLPPEMNMDEIYNLRYALSCLYTGGPFQKLPDTIEHAQIVLEKTKSNPCFNCLFDDLIRSPSDSSFVENTEEYLIHYQEEVYYFLRNQKLSLDICNTFLHMSNSFWHSLCVVSDVDLPNNQKEIPLSFLEDVCRQAQFIVIGAYDGDSYLYWEKNRDSGSW